MIAVLCMRIGIEVQQLASEMRSGLYYYCAQLVDGLKSLSSVHRITLFANGRVSDGKLQDIRKSCLPLPLHTFNQPKRFYRIRVAVAEPNRQDALFYITNQIVPPRMDRVNAYLVPDLTPLLLPLHHTETTRKFWEERFEEIRTHADVVITFSQHTKRDVVRCLGISEDKVCAIPLAAGSQFRPLDDDESLIRDLAAINLKPGQYVLSVGTIEPRKNHILLLRAYRRLLDRGALGGKPLVLAGPMGWHYEGILSEIERLGLNDHVRQVGHFGSLEVLLNGATVMVYPSLFEGFGLPPLEAMACGTPVITSNATSLPEVVGDVAIMVDPEDDEGLANAIGRVNTEPQLRSQMRTAGLARAKTFSWKRTAEETIGAIETAVQRKFPKRRKRLLV